MVRSLADRTFQLCVGLPRLHEEHVHLLGACATQEVGPRADGRVVRGAHAAVREDEGVVERSGFDLS